MLLAIDAGNTNITFALFENDEMKGEWRVTTNGLGTADEIAVWLIQLMKFRDLPADCVDSAIISTVVPQALFDLQQLCQRYFRVTPMIVGSDDVDLGIRALVDRPQEVGADRLVNAVGAHEKYPGPKNIIDFGTATTLDVVDAEGNYCGGVIAPGVNLSLEALHAAAAKLPRIAVGRARTVIGRDTQSCMLSGIYWGYVGMIEGLVARMEAEFGEKMTVIATGGLASLFANATDCIEYTDMDITMRGLRAIHRRNSKG